MRNNQERDIIGEYKRARLDETCIQSHEFQDERSDQNTFEYVPDSCGIEKTCLSPCGKASLTSAVVGSPVAGKPSPRSSARGNFRMIFYVMYFINGTCA